MSKYVYRIVAKPGTITVLPSELVNVLRKQFDGQDIVYGKEPNQVKLVSNSLTDIKEVIVKGYWEHSKKPKNIKTGTVCFILPNFDLSNSQGSIAEGIAFVAQSQPLDVSDDTDKDKWSSEK